MSRYITEFLSLKCTPDILATVGYLGNKPEKEISEAWAIMRKLRKITLRHPNKFQVVDLCSGNALVPVTAVHLLPIIKAYAIDKLPRDRNWHLARNFIYIKEDIHNIKTSLFNKPTILTAVHSCKNLAEQTIKIYNENDQIKHLILMPCCQGNLDNPLLNFIKSEASGDTAWALKLALQCGEGVRVTKDKFVLSPKNYIILAGKKKIEEPAEIIEKLIGEHKRIGEALGGVTLYDAVDFTYVLLREIPEKYRQEFGNWMYGQTCGTMHGETAIYSWDWERWYDLKTKGTPTYFD